MRLRVLAAGAVLAAALPLTACGGGASDAADNPLHLVQPGTISAAVSTDQPPFASAAKGGTPKGYIVDLTDEVAKRLHVKVQYKASTVPGALQGVTTGQYDLAASGLGVTPERERSVAFTKALYWSTTAVLTRKSSSAKGLGDFKGRKVGVVTGAVQERFLDKMPGVVATKFQNQNAAVSQLLSGNLDAFVVGGPDADAYLKQYDSLKVAVSAPVDHPTAMATGRDNTAFRTAVDKQLAAMVADGTFLKIYRRWFTEPPRPELVKVWPALGK
ncbi:substrate-binding periplasmic protein [Actinocatenispora rupis]|uniref:Cysteine ABC transporter substrate-binding protein n=1 Tax=Actinocatenispora rupis TaxID=519421 RepID=A0A8J3N853_9ACTN|nr:transporter substrate-binding domain-containing protein [Actinocatenispora rupis]GID09741.1 cysteine ABC transporter substrate-binding protein [Actinocatenispora rupis]